MAQKFYIYIYVCSSIVVHICTYLLMVKQHELLLIVNFTTVHLMLSRGSVSIELEFRHTLHADVEKLI